MAGIIIRFTCPRGHGMSAPAEKAGANGKCPECQTLLEVPKPPPDYDGKTLLVADEIIEFYCPNEHYLRSPARLQGKRGKCPQCGSTFVVPRIDEQPPEEAPAGGSDAGMLAGVQSADTSAESISGLEEIEQLEEIETISEVPSGSGTHSAAPDFSFFQQTGEWTAAPPSEAPAEVHRHPLGALFERIWEESDREAIVELELKSGERIAPLNYAHDVSRGQFGVFAVRAVDGTHTVTIIAWDDIVRIFVRELKELPPTMFN